MRFLQLILLVLCGHFATAQDSAVAPAAVTLAIDSLQEGALYTVQANLDGCFQRMRHVVRIKKRAGDYYATLWEVGRVTGEGHTTHVDNTYKWRKLSALQVDAVRRFEVMLMSLHTQPDEACSSTPKFILLVPSQAKRVAVKVCWLDFYGEFRKAVFSPELK